MFSRNAHIISHNAFSSRFLKIKLQLTGSRNPYNMNGAFCSSRKCGPITVNERCGRVTPNISITFKPYHPPPSETHDGKNMRLKRPLSPHLTIYAPTLTSLTSISQRISGVIMSFYALLLSSGALFMPSGIDTYIYLIQSCDFSKLSLFIIKFILALPFAYHYFNALRFLGWAGNKWISMNDVKRSAKVIMVYTVIFTTILALF